MSGPVLIAPVRGRVQAHFRRWGSRWSTVAADSFRRIDGNSLGSADTGHTWAESNNAGVGAAWQVEGGVAKAQPGLGGGNQAFALVPQQTGDVRIEVHLRIRDNGAQGTGIAYRVTRDLASGWLCSYGGNDTKVRVYSFAGGVFTDQADFTVGAVGYGGEADLELQALGNVHTVLWNGVSLGTYSNATNKTETHHGLFVHVGSALDADLSGFTRYRSVRNR